MEIDIRLKEWYGWKNYKVENFDVWFNGYILNDSLINFFKRGLELLNNKSTKEHSFDDWVRGARGNFSIIITNKEELFCAVDRIRSIPLFYTINSKKISVGNYIPNIDKNIIINSESYDQQAALEISMSTYTIGKKTLHPKLYQLCSGELLITREGKTKIRTYYQYSPWKTNERSKPTLKKELTEVSRQVLKDMVENANGGQIVVPLSAGNDSRFIVSGLRELGVKNVFCFSYGLNNNFEVETAEKIAKRLGYPWLHIPLSIKSQGQSFKESEFDDFCNFADTLSNSPILIDYSAVKKIKESGKISKDAIFVNGSTGDFITGGHLLPDSVANDNEIKDYLIQSIIEKHYSLWSCLKTTNNINSIVSELEKIISKIISDNALSWSNFAEIGESMEWSGRQSKMISTTQRSYEFHGYSWRLPMWDPLYMDFWESVPKQHKLRQSLYVETLHENNWGGVWNDISVNNFKIASNNVKLVRNFVKIFFVLFGKEAWHKFDKRAFSYFIDDTAATAIVPYRDVFFDKCGARDRNSWIVKKYLFEKGIDIEKIRT